MNEQRMPEPDCPIPEHSNHTSSDGERRSIQDRNSFVDWCFFCQDRERWLSGAKAQRELLLPDKLEHGFTDTPKWREVLTREGWRKVPSVEAIQNKMDAIDYDFAEELHRWLMEEK